jgi:hypothetical protein
MFAKSLEIEVGPVPFEEECAQVGTADYAARSTLECTVYIRQLHRIFGTPDPAKLAFVRRSYPHAFGRYHEVVACITGRWDQVFDERKLPARWDHIALAELAWISLRTRYYREVKDGLRDPLDVPEIYRGNVPDFPDHPVAAWMAKGYAPIPTRRAIAFH